MGAFLAENAPRMTTLLPLLAGLLAPPPDAAALVRRGTELYKAGVYDKAAQAFEEAWKLAPTPTTALNLAQSLEGAGRPADALQWYDKVLAAEADGPRRGAAESGRAHLQAHGYLAVTCGPPGAALTVGALEGQCPTWGAYLPAGTHAVTLTAADRAPHRGEVEVAAGQRRELTLDLAREVQVQVPMPASAAPLAVETQVPPPAEASPEPAVPAWVAYTVMGLGGAALILGGVYYAQAADDIDQAPTGASAEAAKKRAALRDDFETHSTVAYGGLGAGAALLLGGGALLLFGGDF